MRMDLYLDVVCPWCYIGERRLSGALERSTTPATVTVRPFQLDPDAPSQPSPLLESLAGKFGGPERAAEITDHTTRVAAHDGLQLRFDRAVAANTFDAHRLIWFSGTVAPELPRHITRDLFQAHFTDGADIGDPTVLVDLAAEAGMDRDQVHQMLTSDTGTDEVRAQIDHASALGITAVPTLVIEDRWAIQGAQPEDALVEAFDRLADEVTGDDQGDAGSV